VLKGTTITDVSVNALVNFDDKSLCKTIDHICPLLCNAIKGAMGNNPKDM
jgi:hypothetical protein